MNKLMNINCLKITIEKKILLDNINIDIYESEILCLVADSGQGKTLIAKAISNTLHKSYIISSKSDAYNGHSFLGKPNPNILILLQNPRIMLNPVVNIETQIKVVLKANKYPKNEYEQIITNCLKEVDLNIQKVGKLYMHQLSEGMAQRIMLAIILLCKPKLLIADEPTTGLDNIVQKQILDLLKRLQKKYQFTLLLITHDLFVAKNLGDRFIHLKNSEIININFKDLNSIYPINYIKKVKNLTEPVTILEFKDFGSFVYQNKKRLNNLENINLKIFDNEILSIIGESGGGKTSLVKNIFGMQTSTGQIIYRNKIINQKMTKQARQIIFSDIQLIFQNPYDAVNPKMKIKQIIEESYLKKDNQNDYKSEVKSMLLKFGLNKDHLNKFPNQLSGGELQRVVIIRALILKPKILIADEIFSSLDQKIQNIIIEYLLIIKEKTNLTIIFIEHDLKLVENISDRVAVIKSGNLIEVGLTNDIFNKPKSKYTKELIAELI